MLKKTLCCLVLMLIPLVSASLSCLDNELAALPTVRGSLEVKQPGATGREFYADTCVNTSVLKEYTCAGTEPVATEVVCEGVCSEGTCIQEERRRTQLQNAIALSYCSNYERETPLTASAPGLAAYPATQAVDQQRETHWFGQPTDQAPELFVDLGESKCINAATLFFFIKDIPVTLGIEASIDGGIWKTVAPPTTITEQQKELTFTPLYARYLRFIETQTMRGYGELSEIVLNTAEVPDLQLTQIAIVGGASGSTLPHASFKFNKQENSYQTDQYGKATLIAPKEEMTSVKVICPGREAPSTQPEPSLSPPSQVQTIAYPRLALLKEWLALTGKAIFDDPQLSFQQLSQVECSVTGALNEEVTVPAGYSYTPTCTCSDERLELTGEYKAVQLGGNYMDLFIYLVKGSKGYRFRTSNKNSDTPGNFITGLPVTLASQWNCWSGAPCPGGEVGGNSNYGPDIWVPFKLIRNYDQVIWEVNGQRIEKELTDFASDELALQFGGWNDRGSNKIRNTKIICGEADPIEEPPAEPPVVQPPAEPPREEPVEEPHNETVANTTTTLPTFEQEVVPELAFEVVEVRETLSKLANKVIQQQRACGEFRLISPPEVYASDTRRPYAPQLAVDNNLSSGWFGDPDALFPKIFTADFNQEICMNRLDLYVAQSETPLLIEIQVSSDGKTWDTLVKNQEIRGDRYVGVSFPTTVVGRYVRIIEHASARPFGTVQELYISAAPRIKAQPFTVLVENEGGAVLTGTSVIIRGGNEDQELMTKEDGSAQVLDAFSLHGKTIEVACPTTSAAML